MKLARGEARNTMAEAISASFGARPKAFATPPVVTLLTRMPWPANSAAHVRVNAATAEADDEGRQADAGTLNV